jgi:hypothetical protein
MGRVCSTQCGPVHSSTNFQALRPKLADGCTYAYGRLSRKLTMFTTPSCAYQAALRTVCSPRRYHICTMAMNVGATHASKEPRRNLVAMRPIAKSVECQSFARGRQGSGGERTSKVRCGCHAAEHCTPTYRQRPLRAGMSHRVTYQQKTMIARNLPVGSLTRKYATTGCQTSCATYTMAPSQLYWSPTRFVCSIRPNTAA